MIVAFVEVTHVDLQEDLKKALEHVQEEGTNFDFATYVYTRLEFDLSHDDAMVFADQLKVGWSLGDSELDADRLQHAFTEKDKALMFRNVTNALVQLRAKFSDPKFSRDCHTQLVNEYLMHREFYSHSTAVEKTITYHAPA